jgi:hypothetical protein
MVGLPTSGVVVVVFVPWQPKTPEQPDNELQNELQLEY